ncbi:AzlD domain-containing protein [Geomonas sp. RF6]|uniref:AzlD domain-containing protein n=1 Tax=Geomonas sp. RF6 TaxID=2897342 RepID=UPI001E3125A2|nr:AzlD domain-containing protein [Geomonas sp. RF6]UFS70107.1 AzlD domain-containing protein [Geomonas sp. RF6]
MPDIHYVLLIVGMGLATYLPRMLPLTLLSRRQLPRWLTDWLDLVPVAILSSLVAPVLVTTGTPRTFDPSRPDLLAAIPTLFFALKTRSLAGTVIVGMALYWLLGLVLR